MSIFTSKKAIISVFLWGFLLAKPAMATSIEELEKRLQTLESYAFQLRQEIEDFKKSPQPPVSSAAVDTAAQNAANAQNALAAPLAEPKEDIIDRQILVNGQNNLYGKGRQSDAVTSLAVNIAPNPYYKSSATSSAHIAQNQAVQQNVEIKQAETSIAPPAQPIASSVAAPQNQGLNASIAKVQSGQFTEGEQELITYVSNGQNPDMGRAQYWLGKAYYHQAKYNLSAQAFIESYKLAKDTALGPDILLNLSLALVQINEKEDACKVLSTVAQRYPDEKIKIGMAEEEKKRLSCS